MTSSVAVRSAPVIALLVTEVPLHTGEPPWGLRVTASSHTFRGARERLKDCQSVVLADDRARDGRAVQAVVHGGIDSRLCGSKDGPGPEACVDRRLLGRES